MDNEIVGFFIGKWDVFDNFSAFSVTYDGKHYATVEHAFQSLKYEVTSPDLAKKIRLMASPNEAYVLTRNKDIKALRDPSWDEKKIEIMTALIRAKRDQHEIVRDALRSSGNSDIVEMNDNDEFWGWGPGPDHTGRNELGKIWMKIRHETRYNSDETSIDREDVSAPI
ncbi:MAG: NADAR family protein [Candidatus Saccharimonadales bacterium]